MGKMYEALGGEVPKSIPIVAPQEPVKKPNIPSRIGGVVSRVLEVPGAFTGLPASFTRAIMGKDVSSLKAFLNIPQEIAQGWTEGFWKQSDIPTAGKVAQQMGANWGEGLIIDIATDPLNFVGLGLFKKVKLAKEAKWFRKAQQIAETTVQKPMTAPLQQPAKVIVKESPKILAKQFENLASGFQETVETSADLMRKYKIPDYDITTAIKYVGEQIGEYGSKLKTAIDDTIKTVNYKPILEKLITLQKELKTGGLKAAASFVEEVKQGFLAGKKAVQSVKQAVADKQLFDALIKKALPQGEKSFANLDETGKLAVNVWGEISNYLRGVINDIPEIGKLEKSMTDLLTLQKRLALTGGEQITKVAGSVEKIAMEAGQTAGKYAEKLATTTQKELGKIKEAAKIKFPKSIGEVPNALIKAAGKTLKSPKSILGIPGVIKTIEKLKKK